MNKIYKMITSISLLIIAVCLLNIDRQLMDRVKKLEQSNTLFVKEFEKQLQVDSAFRKGFDNTSDFQRHQEDINQMVIRDLQILTQH